MMSEESDLDEGPPDPSTAIHSGANSLISVISSRAQRIGSAARLSFVHNGGQSGATYVEGNRLEELSSEHSGTTGVEGNNLEQHNSEHSGTTDVEGNRLEEHNSEHSGTTDVEGNNLEEQSVALRVITQGASKGETHSQENSTSQTQLVGTQKSEGSTSGYSSAQDLTPENNLSNECEEPPIPRVLRGCVSENSLPSSDGRSTASSVVDNMSDNAPNYRRLQQHHSRDESSGGPAVSHFVSRTTANYQEDTESITGSQESADPHEDIISKILKYSLCGSSGCNDKKCKAGRLIMEKLKVFLDGYNMNTRDFYFENALETLKAVASHSEYCDELKCKLPLCYFFKLHSNVSSQPWKIQVQALRQEYFSGNPLLQLPGPFNYNKLMYPSHSAPVEGADFNNLTRIGDFGYSVISDAFESRWWIKRVHIVVKDRMEHTMMVMEVVSQSPNPNILPQLWCIKQEDHLIYATPYMVTLSQKLSRYRGEGFRLEACWLLMRQMVDAARFLHARNVVYLNWQCKNVIFDEPNGVAKITNFTNSVRLPISDAEDEEDIIATLQEWMPARLVPPEIYSVLHLGVKNDIWGVGALLYEMVTGSIIHEHYHHEEPSTVRELLTDNPVVNLDKIKSQAVRGLLRKSLKVNWSDRATLEDFQKTVFQHLSECQQQRS